MAIFTTTTAVNADTFTSKAGGDTYNVNGPSAFVTVDQHARHGLNQNTSAIFGAINLSASLGGKWTFEGRYLRLIPYDTGTGNVPADGSTISQGSASGALIGVYDSLAVAPTAAGAAMPADGYILIRQWNGTYYAAGALTGIGANATGQDTVGWMEQVGQEGLGITLNRLNNGGVKLVNGAFYKVGVTGGSRSDTYQIPTNGVDQYHSGVLVGKAAPVNISSASWAAGVLTVNTSSAHGFSTGDEVIIEGALPYAYNTETEELSAITVVDSDTFTMPRTNDPGTYTSGGTTVAVEWYATTPSSALVATIGTEAERGKWCWISTAGVLRFGHDGTNSTGGFLPATGIPIYIPNVFLANATSAAKTVNSLAVSPNTRYTVTTTSAGELSIDRASISWRMNAINTPSVLDIRNSSIYTAMNITTNGTKAIFDTICVSSSVAHTNSVLVFTNSTQGATVSDSVFAAPTWGAANQGIFSPSTARGFTFDRCRFMSTGNKNVTSNYTVNGTTLDDCYFTDCTFLVGFVLLNQSSVVEFVNPTYLGASGGKTEVANSSNLFSIISKTSDVVIDGLSYGGISGVTQRGYIASITTGSSNVTLKNMADIASPLDVGGVGLTDVVCSRSGAVCTIPHTAHGYVNGETIVVDISDTSAIQPGPKVITYIDANNYSIACTNTGTLTPKLSFYYSAMTGVISGAAGVVNVTTQNINVIHNNQAPYITVTSNKDFIFENVYTEPRNPTLPTRAGANITEKSCSFGSGANAAIAAVYGTIFLDNFLRDTSTPNPTGLSWTRSGSTISVASPNHNITTGDIAQIYDSSVPAGALNGLASVTVIDSDNLSYVGAPSGTASGTLSYRVSDSRLSILMNEKNDDTTSYYTIGTASAGLTGSGTVSMPTIGDNRTWTMPNYIKGYNSFPNMLPYFLTLTNAQALAFDLTYDIDRGSGFSGTFKSLHVVRSGATGTSGTAVVTGLSSTTGLEVGAKVFGTGIADGAGILTVDSASQITLDTNHTDTVTGSLTFDYLPNEATLPADGFKLKVKIETVATNTTPITAINIPLTSTSTTRARLYPQEQAQTQEVNVTNLVIGSRIQLYDLTSATELANEIVTGTTFDWTDPAPYVADREVRIRLSYVSGTSAKEFVEAIIGTATNTDPILSYRASQVDDDVYNDNAIDGSAVTGVAIDDVDDLIEINTATRSAGQIYAYEMYWLFTSTGIAGDGERIEGVDQANYRVTNTEIKNVTTGPTVPVTITGGYMVDSTTGNSIDLVNTTGGTLFMAPDHVVPFATGSGVTAGDITDIAAAVWDETISGHLTAGTTGKSLKDAKDKSGLAAVT